MPPYPARSTLGFIGSYSRIRSMSRGRRYAQVLTQNTGFGFRQPIGTSSIPFWELSVTYGSWMCRWIFTRMFGPFQGSLYLLPTWVNSFHRVGWFSHEISFSSPYLLLSLSLSILFVSFLATLSSSQELLYLATPMEVGPVGVSSQLKGALFTQRSRRNSGHSGSKDNTVKRMY